MAAAHQHSRVLSFQPQQILLCITTLLYRTLIVCPTVLHFIHHHPLHTTSSCTAMYTLVVTLLPPLVVILPQLSSRNVYMLIIIYWKLAKYHRVGRL